MELYNEAMANRGETTPTYSPDLVTSGSPYANVNWYDEIIRRTFLNIKSILPPPGVQTESNSSIVSAIIQKKDCGSLSLLITNVSICGRT